MQKSTITMTGAEPFFFPSGKVGCLLVHGLTGTPKEMRWMGEYLHQRGISVMGIRLAGHATDPADLPRTRWRDWLASVEDGFHLLNGACEQIFLAGLSLGGALSLYAASYLPAQGVISISAPYQLPPDWRLNFIHLIKHLQPRVPKGPPDWHNPQAAADHLEYPDYPTASIAELRDLLAELRQILPHVNLPTLIVHSRADQGVSPENAIKILNALGSPQKEILWVENSGHVVVREPDRQMVFERVCRFIQSHTPSE
ncbi:MAG: carboxylesterase [Bellilinea sp.]|nr:MAG: carboxylesterase [Bellilinea sp.]